MIDAFGELLQEEMDKIESETPAKSTFLTTFASVSSFKTSLLKINQDFIIVTDSQWQFNNRLRMQKMISWG